MEIMDVLAWVLVAWLTVSSIFAIGLALFRRAELRAQPGLSEERRNSQGRLIVVTLIVSGASLVMAAGLAVSMSL